MRFITPTDARVLIAGTVLCASILPLQSENAQHKAMAIAVLPFERLSALDDDRYLESGFAETLTTALARVSALRVTERGQLRRILQEQHIQNSGLVDEVTAVKIGSITGARHLVLGAFQRSGKVLRVTCRVVDAQTGTVDPTRTVIRTRSLDADADLFNLQDEVCEALLVALSTQPTGREKELVAQVVKATPDRRAYSYYAQAREEYLRGTAEGFAASIPLFERALESDRHYALASAGLSEALSAWGFSKEQAGDDTQDYYRRALASAERAIALDPKLGDGYRALALAYSNLSGKGKPDASRSRQCMQAALKALELNPRDAEVYYLLWNLLGCPLNGPDAELIKKALDINPLLISAWGSLANALEDNGKLDEAVEIYRKAITIDARFTLAHYNLGRVLSDQEKPDEALTAYRRASELSPEDPLVYNAMGNTLYALGRIEEAAAAYSKAIEVSPRYPSAYANMGDLLKKQGQYPEALEFYSKAAALEPDNVVGHFRVGEVLMLVGRLSEAESTFRNVVRLDPNHVAGPYGLGHVFFKQGKLADAEREFRKATQLAPERALCWSNLASALCDQGKLDEAIAAIERARDVDPSHGYAWGVYAYVLYKQDRLEQALVAAQRAVDLDAAEVYSWSGLARILSKLKRYEEAVDACRKGLAANRSDPTIHNLLARALRATGDEKGAIEAMQRYVDLARNDPRERKWLPSARAFLKGK